jgi:putative membrane protein
MFPFDMFGGGFGIWFLVSAVLSIAMTVGLVVLIALGIRWLVRNSESKPGDAGVRDDDTALALLRQRYARGEIDATEFEERKRTLGG